MNEDRFVRFLKKKFSFRQGVGIGDDAAVIRGLNGTQLVTTDLLIEDIHFRLADMTPRELARKSLAVNLSDIAAMGGRPLHFYLGLGFPDRLGLDYLKRFFSGLAGGCKRWRVELAGGDYSRSRQLVIAITVIGCADRPVLRSGARPGDWLAVSRSRPGNRPWDCACCLPESPAVISSTATNEWNRRWSRGGLWRVTPAP